MKDYQEIYIMLVVGTLVVACLIVFIIYFVISYRRRQEQHKQEKRELELHFQQELLKSQLEIQEETLKHISGEIHDNVTQVLTLAKLNLNTLDAGITGAGSEKINDSISLVGKAIKDLRELSHTLHPEYMLDNGLPGAVKYTLDALRKTNSWTIEFDIRGDEKVIHRQKELILFRLVQESINNIVRHASASVIDVKMEYDPEKLTIIVSDNGKGFNVDEVQARKEEGAGLGVRNMSNRARLIGAQFSITSEPNIGTKVLLMLPY